MQNLAPRLHLRHRLQKEMNSKNIEWIYLQDSRKRNLQPGLIPIHLHLKKLVKRSCLRAATLSSQHALMSLLSAKHSKGAPPHPQSLALLNDTQCACLKGPLLDTEASLLNLTECFDSLHVEATPGCKLVDSFSDRVSFHPYNCSSLRDCKTHL